MEQKFKGVIQGAAGGLISGVTLFGAYFVVDAATTGADGGDWLNFAGVIFGVIATIGGTLAIDRIGEWRRHKRAVRNLLPALNVWTRTVDALDDIPSNQNIANLREQIAYIAALTGDLDKGATHVMMTAHAFCFHIPTMIERVQKAAADPPSPMQAVVITFAVDSMREYAAVFRRSLTIGRE